MAIVPSKDMKKLLADLTREYHNNLASSLGETYLLERGITKEAQNYFHLGFVVNPRPEDRAYDGMVVLPYVAGSSVVGLKFRRIDDREPKYMSSVGFEARRIFNPNILKGLYPKIYVTEGEFDTVILHSLSIPAIAIPGANSWNPVVARALRNRRIVVLADGDGKEGKGREAGQKLGKQILTSVDDAAIIIMKDTDVNQYYLDHGGPALKEYIGWKD